MYGGGGYYSNQRVGYGEPLSESQGGNNNNYHRGGGGGGYQRGGYSRGGGGGGGGRNFPASARPPPLTAEQEAEEKLKMMLIRLGDKSASQIHSHLDAMARMIEKDYNKANLNKALAACISQLPMKSHIYAGLVAMLNMRSFDIAADVIDIVASLLDVLLAKGGWIEVKCVLRFYTECFNCQVITGANLLAIYSRFLDAINLEKDLFGGPVKIERNDCFVFLVLSTLPGATAKLSSAHLTEFEALLTRVGSYIEKRAEIHAASQLRPGDFAPILAIEANKVYRGRNTPYEQIDVLTALWKCVCELRQHGWVVDILAKPYKLFEDSLGQQLQHEIRLPLIPADTPEQVYPFQGPVFYIFDRASITLSPELTIHTSLPPNPSTSIDRFLLVDIIKDTIHLFAHNHKECVNYLSRMSSYLDLLPNDTSASVWEAVMEAIMQQLFQLPRSSEKAVYYAVLVAGMCRIISDGFPAAMGKSVKILFSRLDYVGGGGGGSGDDDDAAMALDSSSSSSTSNAASGMDVDCARRFGEWFALHLSNFKYIWKWDDWVNVLELPSSSGRYTFVRELINYCLKLSYVDHVKAFLPTPFLTSGVWDPEGPRTNYKFAHLSVVGGAGSGAANLSELGQLIQELNGRLKVRRVDDSFEEAETCLAKIKTWASVNLLVVEGGGGEEEKVQEDNNNVQKMRDLFKFPDHPDAVAQEVLVQCIMNIGSKSFSHLLNAFERNLILLQTFLSTPSTSVASETTVRTVRLIAEFWKYNPQFLEIAIDKLSLYRIVDPKSVIAWVIETATFESVHSDAEARKLLGKSSLSSSSSAHHQKEEKNGGGNNDEQVHDYEEKMEDVNSVSAGTDLRQYLEVQKDLKRETFYVWHYWGILRTTLRKVNLRVSQLKSRLEEVRSEAQRRQHQNGGGAEDMMDQDAEDDAAVGAAESALATAQRDQKDTFIFLCRKFVEAIQAKTKAADAKGVDITTTAWWRWVVGYFREILRTFDTEIKTFKVTLEMIVFTDAVDRRVLKVWGEVSELYARRFGLVKEHI